MEGNLLRRGRRRWPLVGSGCLDLSRLESSGLLIPKKRCGSYMGEVSSACKSFPPFSPNLQLSTRRNEPDLHGRKKSGRTRTASSPPLARGVCVTMAIRRHSPLPAEPLSAIIDCVVGGRCGSNHATGASKAWKLIANTSHHPENGSSAVAQCRRIAHLHPKLLPCSDATWQNVNPGPNHTLHAAAGARWPC